VSISSLGASSAASYPAVRSTGQTRTPGFVQTAATALGMDVSDVTSALERGSSLADLATKQGVSTDDLAKALEAAAPQDLQGSSDLDAMTQDLIDQKGLHGPGGGHHHGGGGTSATGALTGTMTADQQSTLSSLSGLLGTDPSSLLTSLQSGTSLASVLDAQGVGTDALASSLQKGLLIDTQA
jgi:lambda repressor-like predicted transcriptional regulator